MKLLVPANAKNLAERSLWFKSQVARKLLVEKKVEFGFELKAPLSYLKKAPEFFWGVHLPNSLATDWYYYPKKRKEYLKLIKRISKLKPDYAVLHGINLKWEPPTEEFIQRYANPASGEEYLSMLRVYTKLVREVKRLLPVHLENQALATEYEKDGKWLPVNHLYIGTNRLLDLVDTKKKTGAKILLDIEHLTFALNLLNRQRNYSQVPVEKIDCLSDLDQKVKKIFGYNLKKYYIPYLDRKLTLLDVAKKYKPEIVHVTGSFQDVIPGKRINEHGPIRTDNKTFRHAIRQVLSLKPQVIVSEISNGTMGKNWKHLKRNEDEVSFYNLCKILLEEM